MKGPKLKQQRFVEEYLIDLNATQAAIRAGYSEKTAGQIGEQNLKKLVISAAIETAMAERSERTKVTQDYVLATIVETVERCKQASTVLDRKGEPVLVETPGGDLAPAYTFDARAVLKGAELMGRHLKMFTDKQELTGKDGEPLQQQHGVLVVPAKVSVDEWVEQARKLREGRK